MISVVAGERTAENVVAVVNDFKHEPLSPEQLRADMAAVQTGYSAEGRALDPDVVTALLRWMAAR